MWYFSWILGTAFACSFAILFGIWSEFHSKEQN
jgi:cyd operon protein YbgT